MHGLVTGTPLAAVSVAQVGGGAMTLGVPAAPHAWQLIIVYRGLHCPICKTYLQKLQDLMPEFHAVGVDVITLSADSEVKAQSMVDEMGLTLPMGYGLTPAQMTQLGLYISGPRTPQEAEAPFAEPAMFVINGEGVLKMIDISNAPFLRPDLDQVLRGVKANQVEGYPIRGTYRA
jgi:peroxiredoxin